MHGVDGRPRILLVATRSADRHLGGSALRAALARRALERLGDVTMALVDEAPPDRPDPSIDPRVVRIQRVRRGLPYRWATASAVVGGRGRRWDRYAVGSWMLTEPEPATAFDLGWFVKTRSLLAWPGVRPERVVLDFDDLEEDTLIRSRSGARIVAHATAGLRSRLSRDADVLVACTRADVARLPAGRPREILPNAMPSVVGTTPPSARAHLLFVGHLGYPPNREAVTWFVREVLARLRASHPDVRVRIVGPGFEHLPTDVRSMVDVVGAAPDVAPHYEWARAVIVPLRRGSGTSVKVLEALAHRRPVVSTTTGVRGLDGIGDAGVVVGDDAEAFAAACAEMLRPGRAESLAQVRTTRADREWSSGTVEERVREIARTALGHPGRLWVDVSSVHARIGTPHGIARVEAGLARAIAKIDARSTAVWVGRSGVTFGSRSHLLAVDDGGGSTAPAFGPMPTSRPAAIVGARVVRPLLAVRDHARRHRDRRRWRATVRPCDAVLVVGHDWDNGTVDAIRRLPRSLRPRLVVVVHDLIPLHRPEFVPDRRARRRFERWITWVAAEADSIVAVSAATADEIARAADGRLIARPRRVVIVRPAVQLEATCAPVDLPEGPFVVYVGTVEVRKNHRLLVRAVEDAADRGQRLPTTVWVGSWGWGVEGLRTDHPAIVHVDGVPDAQLRWLVENAAAVVYPSLEEGFGLPVAEARALGTPVIASDIPAVREAAGGVGRFLDPHDVDAWRAALVDVVECPPPRCAPAAPRTWAQAAAEVLDVLGSHGDRHGGGLSTGPPT